MTIPRTTKSYFNNSLDQGLFLNSMEMQHDLCPYINVEVKKM